MARFKFWQASEDYFKTRKQLLVKFVPPIIASTIYALAMTVLDIKCGIVIADVFKDFVNVQIGAIAILISFSIAIMTILVTTENKNIIRIKEKESSECKPLNGYSINLYQVLLSNITYNIFVEVVYLVVLLAFIFIQLFVCDAVLKALMGVSIFFIIHILHILLESVGQMYLTFWKNHE
jgi:hypothetical protein